MYPKFMNLDINLFALYTQKDTTHRYPPVTLSKSCIKKFSALV